VILRLLMGTALPLPDDLARAWPELREARFRLGGLPARMGGWLLGARSVDGIVLGRTVWLAAAPSIRDAGLLLHEIRHVQQFATVAWFPCRYLWQAVTRGYERNPYEVDARAYAARRLRESGSSPVSPQPAPEGRSRTNSHEEGVAG
jgi:hypothetical protein